MNMIKSNEYTLLEQKIEHLKELMLQHDKLTELAILKAEDSVNERFAKANEFREQQKDIIATFARKKEVDDGFIAINEKIATLATHLSEKRDTMLKTIEDKLAASVMTEGNRFSAVDKQMQTLIDANADVSNRGLLELNKWKESTQGSIRVILSVGGFISALVLALIIAFIAKLF